MQNTSSARLGASAAATIVVLSLAMVVPSGATEPSFPTAPVTQIGGFEPGIDVGPDGSIFVNVPTGLGGHSTLARSTNGGASFQRLTFDRPESLYPGGGDSDVVVTDGPDGQNRVYFLDLWGGSNSLAVSNDNGNTWSSGTPLTTLPLSDRQWISLGSRDPATGKDVVYALYQQLNPPNWLMFSRSNDGGETWAFHRPLPGLVGSSLGPPGNLVSTGDFVGFPVSAGGQVRFIYSTDGGLLDWQISEVSLLTAATGTIPSASFDGDLGYITWTEGSDHVVRVARSTDRGQTWTDVDQVLQRFVILSDPGTSNVFPWIDARTTPQTGAKVAVSWYSTPAIDPANLSPDGQADGAWRVMYVESFDGGITWTAPTEAFSEVVLEGGVCTSGLGCSLPDSSGSRALGDFMQIAIDESGSSILAFGDNGTGRVAVQSL